MFLSILNDCVILVWLCTIIQKSCIRHGQHRLTFSQWHNFLCCCCFYIVLFSAREQTHHAPVACDSEWVTVAFYRVSWISIELVYLQCSLVATWLVPCETAAVSAHVLWTPYNHVWFMIYFSEVIWYVWKIMFCLINCGAAVQCIWVCPDSYTRLRAFRDIYT